MIKILRQKRNGCWIGNDFVGIVVYADNIVLLSPAIDGLQSTIDTCSKYAENYNLSFSTNDDPKERKTRCKVFRNKDDQPKRRMVLNGKPLPWVKSVTHLGVKTNDQRARGQDTLEKRAQYVSKCNELQQAGVPFC